MSDMAEISQAAAGDGATADRERAPQKSYKATVLWLLQFDSTAWCDHRIRVPTTAAALAMMIHDRTANELANDLQRARYNARRDDLAKWQNARRKAF